MAEAARAIRFSYRHVPTVLRFARSDAFIRGLMGPFGSGKSSGCVVEIVRRAMAQKQGPDGIRRTRWAVVRNTYPQLNDTTIKTFMDWFPSGTFGRYRRQAHDYLITAFEDTEIEILFRALDRPDHVKNLLSLELTGAWVNEAREVPWAIVDGLTGRVGRYPARRDGGATWFGIFMDTNPPDTDSDWYGFFEEKCPENAAIFRQPSGNSAEAENLPHLPVNYYANLAVGKDADWIKVYVDGEYGFLKDGMPVYPSYNDNIHCREIEHIPGLPMYRGWDFGLTPACVFLQVAGNGQVRIYDELCAERAGIESFGRIVKQHSLRKYSRFLPPNGSFEDIGDPAGKDSVQTDERSCFDILRGMGVEITGGRQTLSMRLESVRYGLNQLIDGEPGLLIHPRCRMLRKGFQGAYKYRRLLTGNESYHNKPEKNSYSHPHDALQYPLTILVGPMVRGYDHHALERPVPQTAGLDYDPHNPSGPASGPQLQTTSGMNWNPHQ